MERSELLRHVDHTLLKPESTWADIRRICDEGMQYHTASVCIPPAFVRRAAEYVQGGVKICTVIGFPNGYATSAVKAFEAADAVANGVDEIDMVINIGLAKEHDWAGVEDEIRRVKDACGGRVLKVIIETCLLTEEEKIALAGVVSRSGADYIKTSTGFSAGGATPEDVALLRAHCAPELKIKAAGGIATLADGENYLRLGADRLGTSRIVRLVQAEEA